MASLGGPNIVTNGLVLSLDAANPKSYVSGSTTWKSLVSTYSGSLNSTAFSSANNGNLVFSGSSGVAGVTTNYNSVLNDFSVCVWFKAAPQISTGRLVDKNYQTGFWLGYAAGNSTTGSWGGGIIQSLPPYGLYVGPFDQNQWNFICMTRAGSTQTLYGNGSSMYATQSCSSAAIDSSSLTVGYGGGTWLNGNIANIQIYNRALSAAEILQNYNATKSRFNL